MESIADARIFGHSLGVPVTCKVRHRFETGPGSMPIPISIWEIFDVSHPLPNGIYMVDAGGAGARRMHNLGGQWTRAR